MEFRYQTESGETALVTLDRSGDFHRATVAIGDEPPRAYNVRARQLSPGTLLLELDGRALTVHLASDEKRTLVAAGGRTVVLEPPRQPSKRGPRAGQDTLEATMPGQVIAVAVAAGDMVDRGQTLVVIEAMKMELRVTAPHAGRVLNVAVEVGDVVERGQRLVELAEAQ